MKKLILSFLFLISINNFASLENCIERSGSLYCLDTKTNCIVESGKIYCPKSIKEMLVSCNGDHCDRNIIEFRTPVQYDENGRNAKGKVIIPSPANRPGMPVFGSGANQR